MSNPRQHQIYPRRRTRRRPDIPVGDPPRRRHPIHLWGSCDFIRPIGLAERGIAAVQDAGLRGNEGTYTDVKDVLDLRCGCVREMFESYS